MINIKRLKDEDKGRWVIYKTSFKKEEGKIKSWNDNWIFIVYKCNNKWNRYYNYTGCATNPNDLTFK